MRTLLLALILLCPQQVTAPEWIVVFEVKQEKPILDPVVRINVVVKANTEGEAAIRAHTYVTALMRDEGKLIFLEAAPKK